MRDLFGEYLRESSDLLPFYARPPSALLSTIPENRNVPAPLVEEIRHYNHHIGADSSFDGTESIIVTGQQPGVFGGPLYTLYKAISAIQLARHVQESTGKPCVPIFWAASEDHDFEEAATTHLLTKKDEPLELTYTPKSDVAGLPMYRVPIEDGIHTLIDVAAREARKSEQTEEVLDFLHESASQAESLCEWSVRLLARMFRDTPLVFFVPHLRAARALQADVLEREIGQPLESTQRLNAAGNALQEKDFLPQVTKAENECNFFLEVAGRRRKVLYEDNRFQLPEENVSFSNQDSLELLRAEPERFSANVALRPVVQQRLFNAIAYVGGPSEVAYWGQLKGVFDFFNLPMPVVYPRAQCALSTTKLNKLMGKLSLTVDDLEAPSEQLEQRVLRASAQNPVLEELTTGNEAIQQRFRELSETIGPLDPVTKDMVDAVSSRTDLEFERIENTLIRRDEAHVEAVRSQIRRLQQTLMPWRKPQERVYTVFSFLFEHGWGLVARLLDEIDIESFQRHEVEL